MKPQQPGLREFDLLRGICRLIAAYLGKPVDQGSIAKLLTRPGAPLAQFRVRDFVARVDLDCLIA